MSLKNPCIINLNHSLVTAATLSPRMECCPSPGPLCSPHVPSSRAPTHGTRPRPCPRPVPGTTLYLVPHLGPLHEGCSYSSLGMNPGMKGPGRAGMCRCSLRGLEKGGQL